MYTHSPAIEVSKGWCYVKLFLAFPSSCWPTTQHIQKLLSPQQYFWLIVKYLQEGEWVVLQYFRERVNAGMLKVWQTPGRLMFGSRPRASKPQWNTITHIYFGIHNAMYPAYLAWHPSYLIPKHSLLKQTKILPHLTSQTSICAVIIWLIWHHKSKDTSSLPLFLN